MCLVEQLSWTAENISRYISDHTPLVHHSSEVSANWDHPIMYLCACSTLAPARLSPYICCQKDKFRDN